MQCPAWVAAHPSLPTHLLPTAHSCPGPALPNRTRPCSMFETWLVLEWCDRGSLAEFITTKKLPPAGSDPQQREAWILLCLLDIALGLNYLHSSGIVSAELG